MKYELVPKDVLDEALMAMFQAIQALEKIGDKESVLALSRAYNSLQSNRTYVAIQPEQK
ncbi:MAG: hypothetical protein WC623_22480 [Pedobacter sp.]|uniref:hypothetical protein n=1 Tax=Pedobacter sp. TaxID=1411316 RepID=UPI0035681AEE